MSARRAVIVSMAVLIVLASGVLFTALSLRVSSSSLGSSSVLRFDVPSELEESLLPFRPFSPSAFRLPRMTVWDVVHTLKRAASDPRIESLVLHIDEVDWGWAKLDEVRSAVREFKEAGKPVYASLSGGGEREYLLASSADRVCAAPTVTLQLNGLAATAMFYRGTFDKFGITPNFAHVGQYKSAVETYTHTSLTPPSRAALESVLDDHYALLADSLASARGVTSASIRTLLDQGPYDAPVALARGLIDTLLYPADVDSLAQRGSGRRLSSISFTRYLNRVNEPRSGPHIALVVASGAIASGRSRESPTEGRILGAETLIDALREVRSRRSIAAVVLRIDSPGGEGDASDAIWREVMRCRDVKPVVVSMSDLAASGGYYIAVAADSLVAHPTTLTGSIGVFGGKFNILGLLHKVGLNVETVSRGRHAQMLSPFEDFSPEEARLFQEHTEGFYRVFLSKVARGRHMHEAAVDSLAQGRVWTGLAAKECGLVDRLGGLNEAFQMARARAHIPADEEIVVEPYPKVQRPLLSRMLADLIDVDDSQTRLFASLPPVLQAWLAAARFPAGATLALMPYSIDIR